MKKLLLFTIICFMVLPNKIKAQNDGAIAGAVAGGLLAIGAGLLL
ncbi:hypothetical protein DFQ09_103317 [Winogradskyella pacifica]|uniref:Uncharacterized protein n=1 Tax=Winogradskyella pacifica TaxID=664642 RepID=A0A3D9MY85_9FLAO|nr:hypothetical protein [Winogradskyella pacifica]REE25010.1 hypothetical protein DFQ09_103317 [Winogradskyella pacifica]